MNRIMALVASGALAVLLTCDVALLPAGKPAQAAFPGQNGKIAFVSDRDYQDGGNLEIYAMNPDGTDQARLTNSPRPDQWPAWSPDGTKIAFVSERDRNEEIYVMNADGTDQIRLTNNPAGDWHPIWSPDGTKIAFESVRDGNFEIYVMNADGTGQTNLTNSPLNDALPAWQPLPYTFSGFFSPVNNPSDFNSLKKAGAAVPVKFSLGGNQDLDIFAENYPNSQQIDCNFTAPLDNTEQTVTAGESKLSYDATSDQYTYIWKTEKAWAGTCRQFTMKLDDGTTHSANFKFAK